MISEYLVMSCTCFCDGDEIVMCDDYNTAVKEAKRLSEWYDARGIDYQVNIYENCEKQRRERT